MIVEIYVTRCFIGPNASQPAIHVRTFRCSDWVLHTMFQSLQGTIASTKGVFTANETSVEGSVSSNDDKQIQEFVHPEFCKEPGVVSSVQEYEGRQERSYKKTPWTKFLVRLNALFETDNEDGRPWKTTFILFGPLSGIFTMIVAISSMIASLGILLGSEGVDIRNWQAPPSTYLAVLTAVCNLSIRYACIQGVVIAWWYRASCGTTLAKLHYDWRAGTTLRGALTSGRHMGLLGVACILSTIVVIGQLIHEQPNAHVVAC